MRSVRPHEIDARETGDRNTCVLILESRIESRHGSAQATVTVEQDLSD